MTDEISDITCRGCFHKDPVVVGAAITIRCDSPLAPEKDQLDNYDDIAPEWCPIRKLRTRAERDIERKTVYIPAEIMPKTQNEMEAIFSGGPSKTSGVTYGIHEDYCQFLKECTVGLKKVDQGLADIKEILQLPDTPVRTDSRITHIIESAPGNVVCERGCTWCCIFSIRWMFP